MRGEVKLQYLVRVPYIISRLGHEPNIRARCNEQVAQAPLSQHNRVTLEFFLPGCELNAAIATMENDYDLPHDGLRIAVQSLRDLVMLDVVNEGAARQVRSHRKSFERCHFRVEKLSV